MSDAASREPIDRDDAIAELVVQAQSLLERGDEARLAALLEAHPDAAEQVRDLLPMLRGLAELSDDALADAAADDGDAPERLGEFRIIRELGRGGMGLVYLAEQCPLARLVALKILPRSAVVDPLQVQRFANEVQAAALLQHPHIVPIYAFGSDQGLRYFAMQYIEGPTVAEVIAALRRSVIEGESVGARVGSATAADRSTKPSSLNQNDVSPGDWEDLHANVADYLPQAISFGSREYFRWAARLIRQAAEALDHAHQRGVLHRDVKPANLMLDRSGDVWVADFGLARMADDVQLTTTGDVLGTLRYMSPEQALAKRGMVDQRSDVYSLGATFYELLTLRPAHEGTDRRELLHQLAFSEPVRPRKVDGRIPVELETIARKSLEQEPQDRYQTAQELVEDLERYLEHRPLRAKSPGPLLRLSKWTRRHAGVAWTIAAACILLAAVTGFSAVVFDHLRSDAQAARETAEANASSARNHEAEAIAARQHAQQLLYVSDVQLASRALEEGDVPRCVSLLERHVPAPGDQDLRDFAWHYLARRTQLRSDWQVELGGEVRGLAASPDGRVVAAVTSEGRLSLLRSEDGRLLQSLAYDHPLNDVAWSPSGHRLAATAENGAVAIWSWLQLDRDEQKSVVGGASPAEQDWSLTAPEAASLAAHDGDAMACVFGATDERLITAGADGTVREWNVPAGEAVRLLARHSRGVRQLAVSPVDGEVVAARGRDATLQWNAAGEASELSWNLPPDARSLRFSPDGELLAAGYVDGVLAVQEKGTTEVAIAQLLDGVSELCFLADSRRLLTGDRGGTIQMWAIGRDDENRLRIAKDSSLAGVAHAGRIFGLCRLDRPNAVASGGADGWVRAWSLERSPVLASLGTARDFDVDGEGDIVLAKDQIRRVNQTVDEPSHETPLGRRSDPVQFVAVGRSGTIAACSTERRIVALDSAAQVETAAWEVAAQPSDFDIAPDGQNVAAAYWNRGEFVDLFDVESGKRTEIPARQSHCVRFSHDGSLLAVGDGDNLVIHALGAGGPPVTLAGHDSTLSDAAFHPSMAMAATVSHDRLLKTWSVPDGRLLASVRAHFDQARTVDFSPDGKTLATGGYDQTVRLWDVETLQPLLTVPTRQRVSKVRFAPDSQRLVVRLHDGEVLVLDAR